MNIGRFPFWLLALNVVASALHLTHNVIYFDAYPEPAWLNAHRVDAWGIAAVAALILGYRLYNAGRRQLGLGLIAFFALSSALVLMHYRYGSIWDQSFIVNFLIWLEFVADLPLLVWLGLAGRALLASAKAR